MVSLRSLSLLRRAGIWSYVSAALVLCLRSLSCSVLANFSCSVSKVLRRFIASFLAIHCAFLFDGKVCPHTQTARLACTVVSHCRHTFFRRLSLSFGQPPCIQRTECMSADCQLKNVFSPETTRSSLEHCPHKKNETLAAQLCYLRRKICTTHQCNTRMRISRFLANTN